MSYEAVEWALEIEHLRPAIKLVLVALGERADATGGSCHPGITELARRASTSRRRVVEAIRELEKIGALRVSRSPASEGLRRRVNQYQLAVGKTIEVPKTVSKSATKKGTRLVPQGNQVGSPGCTVTFLEPSLNLHSESYDSARFQENARGAAFEKSALAFPEPSMVAAAEAAGADSERLAAVIADCRGQLVEDAQSGDPKARKQYRTLWFALMNGDVPDLEDKL
jgi:hypothetical protein